MKLFVYMHVYVYMYMYMYVYVYVYVYEYVYVCVYIYMCVWVCVCIYVYIYMYRCMCICIYMWIDGWILTVDALPIRGPDPGTPLAGWGGHPVAHMHAPDPTRMHCTQGPKGCKQPGIYKPCLLKKLAEFGKAVHSRPLPPLREAAHKVRQQDMEHFYMPSATIWRKFI